MAPWSWSHFEVPHVGQLLATGCRLHRGGLAFWARWLSFGHGQFSIGGGICELSAANIHSSWGPGCTCSVNGTCLCPRFLYL